MTQSRPKAAFLGPEHSYSHQAAQQLLSDIDVDLIPYPSITNVYNAAPEIEYSILPFENTIHGIVADTLSALLFGSGSAKEDDARRWKIIKSFELKVDHCLVVRRGVKVEDVKWVRSHEQALGQCSTYLSTHLPHATRIPFPSTAQAATYLASLARKAQNNTSSSSTTGNGGGNGNEGEENGMQDTVMSEFLPEASSRSRFNHLKSQVGKDEAEKAENVRVGVVDEGEGAALCSSAVAEELGDVLEIVEKGVQNVRNNYTRFLLLQRDTDQSPSTSTSSSSTDINTTILRTPSPSTLSLLPAQHKLLAIWSKADTSVGESGAGGDRFRKMYLVEVEGEAGVEGKGEWEVLGYT